MPPSLALVGGLAVLGIVLVAIGLGWMRLIGADPGRARRLAGARGLTPADVLDLASAPERPVRVSGRIRCADPLVAPDDEELVAYHRDVSVRLPDGRWRTIEQIRESRSFELWDHAGSLTVDPASVAEPIISIPLVWEGSPDELTGPHAAAVARLADQHLAPTAARAITHTISVVDRIGVLADVRISASGPELAPPAGGYLISTLEVDDAMRLLGGARRRQLVAAMGTIAVGVALLVASLVTLIATSAFGA